MLPQPQVRQAMLLFVLPLSLLPRAGGRPTKVCLNFCARGSHEFLLVAGSSGGDAKSSELIIDTSFRQASLAFKQLWRALSAVLSGRPPACKCYAALTRMLAPAAGSNSPSRRPQSTTRSSFACCRPSLWAPPRAWYRWCS